MKRDYVAIFSMIAGMVLTGLILWTYTTWDIIEVIFGAITGYLALCGIVITVIAYCKYMVELQGKKAELERQKEEYRKSKFKTYRIQSKVVGVQYEDDKDLIELIQGWEAIKE